MSLPCDQVRDRLYAADALDDARLGADLRSHLDGCAACAALRAHLRRIDAAGRALPVPADSAAVRNAFLRRLEAPITSAGPADDRGARGRPGRTLRLRPSPPWRRPAARLAAAALFLLGAGLGAWLVLSAGTQPAVASDAVDRLVALNVDLAEADSPQERSRLFAEREPVLRRMLEKDPLSPDDRQLGSALLENGAWLSANTDPLAGAQRFHALADGLLVRLQKAAAAGDTRAVARLGKRYAELQARGLDAQLGRAAKANLDKPDRRRQYDRLVSDHAALQRRVDQMVDQSPERSKKELRRLLNQARQQQKKEPRAHPKGQVY